MSEFQGIGDKVSDDLFDTLLIRVKLCQAVEANNRLEGDPSVLSLELTHLDHIIHEIVQFKPTMDYLQLVKLNL